MPTVVTEPCRGVKDKACMAVCPVDCFHEDGDQLYIDPECCIDCGACEAECPVEAIFLDEDVPAKWKSYIALNAERAAITPPATPGK
ncbi:MAG: indolepyruvate ferredoxin oxidoreductase subunit alpha [Thermoanaerobaculia bacterium]